jgi:hypothetical protein
MHLLWVIVLNALPLGGVGFGTLPPAAPSPKLYKTAGDVPLVGLNESPYELSLLDRALLGAFRRTLQRQTGVALPELQGFDGLVAELRVYQSSHSVVEQAAASENTMIALAGPLPAVYSAIVPRVVSPGVLAWFTVRLLKFLVGRMTLTERAEGDPRFGGVLVERCSVLENSACKGVCLRMCKLPTEKFFAESWGTPLHMQPNFETFECQLSFGVVPPAPETDLTLPQGCLSQCPAALPGDCAQSSS